MANPMFTVCHKPIGVGSLLRHHGAGHRIFFVTKRKGDEVTFRYYGSTNKGDFKFARRARHHTGTIINCANLGCDGKCRVEAHVGHYTYGHVTQG